MVKRRYNAAALGSGITVMIAMVALGWCLGPGAREWQVAAAGPAREVLAGTGLASVLLPEFARLWLSNLVAANPWLATRIGVLLALLASGLGIWCLALVVAGRRRYRRFGLWGAGSLVYLMSMPGVRDAIFVPALGLALQLGAAVLMATAALTIGNLAGWRRHCAGALLGIAAGALGLQVALALLVWLTVWSLVGIGAGRRPGIGAWIGCGAGIVIGSLTAAFWMTGVNGEVIWQSLGIAGGSGSLLALQLCTSPLVVVALVWLVGFGRMAGRRVQRTAETPTWRVAVVVGLAIAGCVAVTATDVLLARQLTGKSYGLQAALVLLIMGTVAFRIGWDDRLRPFAIMPPKYLAIFFVLALLLPQGARLKSLGQALAGPAWERRARVEEQRQLLQKAAQQGNNRVRLPPLVSVPLIDGYELAEDPQALGNRLCGKVMGVPQVEVARRQRQ